MSCNFKISTHQNSDNVHLKLTGDFDGSSACELINALSGYSAKKNRIFVHTAGLHDVKTFGMLVFERDFAGIKRKPVAFVFTGKKLRP